MLAPTSIVLIGAVCTLIVVGFLLSSERFEHWFLVPVTVCGVLIGVDGVEWVRGRLPAFDPIGIFGLLGFHFFFLAPLLHVHLDYWMSLVTPPADWRDWLGWMGMVNILGLGLYRLALHRSMKAVRNEKGTERQFDRSRFIVGIGIALALTLSLQLWVYLQYGGILGYILAFEGESAAFRGMGWIFTISESFPILAMIGFAVYARSREGLHSWWVLALVMILYFGLKMLFGGLRGSRANTVWGLFWAAGIIHLWLRPIPKKLVLFGIGFLIAFLYLYGFYKGAGRDALRAFQGAEERAQLSRKTGKTMEGALLGDLARSDVQAFLLYRIEGPGSDYRYALGRTYLGAVAMVVPRAIWPTRPPTKEKEGTEAQYGSNTYHAGFYSTRQYGLAGEAMLNFGLAAVPVVYYLFGMLVGRLRGWMRSWREGDVRLLFIPFLIYLCFIVLVGDSDNVIFFFVKNGVVPVALLALCSKTVRRDFAPREANAPSSVPAPVAAQPRRWPGL